MIKHGLKWRWIHTSAVKVIGIMALIEIEFNKCKVILFLCCAILIKPRWEFVGIEGLSLNERNKADRG